MVYVIGRINVRKRTKHHIRKMVVAHLLTLWELSDSERAEFDYVSDSEDDHQQRFVRYQGNVHDVYDTQVLRGRTMGDFPDNNNQFRNWDSIATDSYWSGTVFKFIGTDHCKVGSWIAS